MCSLPPFGCQFLASLSPLTSIIFLTRKLKFLSVKFKKIFNFSSGYDMNLYNVYTMLLQSASFWVLTSVVTVAALLPDFTFKTMEALRILPKTIYPGNDEYKRRKLLKNRGFDTTETTYL